MVEFFEGGDLLFVFTLEFLATDSFFICLAFSLVLDSTVPLKSNFPLPFPIKLTYKSSFKGV